MSSTSDSLGRRAGRAFTRLVVTLLVFALLGAVGFLLSRLNARTFTVAGLLAVFIVAVIAVLVSKLVPGRFTEYVERVRRRVR